MLRVFVDTSSLLFGFRNRHNLVEIIKNEFYDAEIVVSKGVINELERISQGKRAVAPAARLALRAIESGKVKIEENSELPDKWLARKKGKEAVVCTNDIKLKKLLKQRGVRVLSLTRNGTLK